MDGGREIRKRLFIAMRGVWAYASDFQLAGARFEGE